MLGAWLVRLEWGGLGLVFLNLIYLPICPDTLIIIINHATKHKIRSDLLLLGAPGELVPWSWFSQK